MAGSCRTRQLQITTLVACAWCGWLALRTRTAALSTVFTVLAFLLTIAVVSDFGLRAAIEEGRWDRLAVSLFPLVAVYALLGAAAERTGGRGSAGRCTWEAPCCSCSCWSSWRSTDARCSTWAGSRSRRGSRGGQQSALLDTVAVMTINGVMFYAAGPRSCGADRSRRRQRRRSCSHRAVRAAASARLPGPHR